MKIDIAVEQSYKRSLGTVGFENEWSAGLVRTAKDQQGYSGKGRNILRLRVGWRRNYHRAPSALVQLSWGRGAGYIGGWTVFCGYNTQQLHYAQWMRGGMRFDGRRYSWLTRKTRVQVLATANANLVPYL